jgi:hypothetical protein
MDRELSPVVIGPKATLLSVDEDGRPRPESESQQQEQDEDEAYRFPFWVVPPPFSTAYFCESVPCCCLPCALIDWIKGQDTEQREKHKRAGGPQKVQLVPT